MGDEKLHLFGEYELDRGRASLLRAGRPVHLRPLAYEVLEYLAVNKGRVVSKDEFNEKVWGGAAVTDDSLVQCLREVRHALGEGGERNIKTKRGKGYIFDPEAGALENSKSTPAIADSYPVLTEQIDVVRLVDHYEEESVGRVDGSVEFPARATPMPLERGQPAVRWRTFSLAAACLLAVGLVAGTAYYFLRQVPSKHAGPAGVGSLAVLPFKPLVPEGRDEALEVGMADTLIAKLGNIGGLSVSPLGAVRRYGGLEQDPLAAGRQLGVEAVLDGTIQRSGDRVGVTARLLSVGDGRQLWEGRFDAPFTDIFSVQDAISAKVAGSLRPRLTGAEERRLAKHFTENAEAYEHYLKGRHLTRKHTLPDIQAGVSYFRKAIEVDPSYALAYVGLTEAYRLLALSVDEPPTKLMPQAKEAAQRAVKIDEELAEAHVALGSILFWHDWDRAVAEKEFKRALELDPDNASAYEHYSYVPAVAGRHEEGLAVIKRARELDPLNLRVRAIEAWILINAGRPDEALAMLQKTLELDPNYWLARHYAASAYIEKGMYEEAVAEARKAREAPGVATRPAAFLGHALAKVGRRAEALTELEGLLKLAQRQYVSPYSIAMIYNGLGDRAETLEWLERGYREREPRLVFLKAEPKWKNLHDDPRFQDLLRRIGLPQDQ
jgi:DNA-binding winged helix-turn-helix (wHTH) protein/TolB-like protein/Tfp pilus assembly protein PilF